MIFTYDNSFFRQITAPEYHVEDMVTPAVLFSGSHDTLADPVDVGDLKDRIKNLHYFEEIQGWNHADFLFGANAPQKLYSKIIKMLKDDLDSAA